MVVEVDAKQFVDWLLHLPTKKRLKPARATDLTSVGCRLAGLARTKPELSFLSDLAFDVWSLLIDLPEGEVASNDDCIRFLEDFALYFPNHDLKAAVTAIKSTTDAKGKKIIRSSRQIEYRVERPVLFAPAASYGPARSKRPPVDDISERLGIAVDAMTKADYKHPVTYVANVLKQSGLLPDSSCTISHVGSRIKKLGVEIPLAHHVVFPWLFAYWHSQHPDYASQTAHQEWPERFVFMKCDC